MSRQRVLVAVAVWLTVVAGVSTLVWVVISRAGDDLEASGQAVVSTAPDRGRSGADGAGGSPRPSRTSSPTRTPSPTPTSPAPSTTDSTSPSPTASSTPDPPTSSPPATPPSATRRTWQGAAGTVVVACDGGRARLVSAQPATGFHAEVKPEDAALVVEFEGREDRSGTDVELVARCVDGVPTFSAHSSGSSEDD